MIDEERYPLVHSVVQLRFKLGRVKKITVERSVFYELESEAAHMKHENPVHFYIGEMKYGVHIQICGIAVEIAE